MRHGPHHGAQQSSSTVPLEFETISANESSPMTIGLPKSSAAERNSSGVLHLPHLAIFPAALAGSTRFFVPQFLQTTTGMMFTSLMFRPFEPMFDMLQLVVGELPISRYDVTNCILLEGG